MRVEDELRTEVQKNNEDVDHRQLEALNTTVEESDMKPKDAHTYLSASSTRPRSCNSRDSRPERSRWKRRGNV